MNSCQAKLPQTIWRWSQPFERAKFDAYTTWSVWNWKHSRSKFDKLDPFSRASSLSKAKVPIVLDLQICNIASRLEAIDIRSWQCEACGWYHSNAAGAVSQSEPSISMPRPMKIQHATRLETISDTGRLLLNGTCCFWDPRPPSFVFFFSTVVILFTFLWNRQRTTGVDCQHSAKEASSSSSISIRHGPSRAFVDLPWDCSKGKRKRTIEEEEA